MHSLTDVPVFAMGPCQELFGGVYSNIDIFFNMANCLSLAQPTDTSASNTTSLPTSTPAPFKGAAPTNRIQGGLWVGMLVFQLLIGWVAFNL